MSRWKTNFQSQQALEKVVNALSRLQSAKLDGISSSERTEYERAIKVLKLLETRLATLDPELFNQNTWGNFSVWLNNIQNFTNNVLQNPGSGYLQHINNALDEILNVLRPFDVPFSEKEVKALSEASAVYQQKLVEELESVKKTR